MAQDVKPAIRGVNKRTTTSRLPGAGLSKRSRVPSLLSEIRAAPPPLPKPPRLTSSRMRQDYSGDSSDDQDRGSHRLVQKMKETSSECYG